MKRLLFCLIAAGAAFGSSAFTALASKTNFTIYYYVLSDTGIYRRSATTPFSFNCEGTAAYKCFIGYPTYQGESFIATSMPANPTVQSASNGLYLP